MNLWRSGLIPVNPKPIVVFETCPKCGMSILSHLPSGVRRCCNNECRHEWTVKA